MTSDRYAWRQNPGVGKYFEAVITGEISGGKEEKRTNGRTEGGDRDNWRNGEKGWRERKKGKKITDKFHQNYKGYQFALKFVTISFEL